MRRDPAAVAPFAIDQFGRFRGEGADRVEDAEAPQLSVGVGGQRDRGPDLGQLSRLFEDLRRQTTLSQCDSECQAADSAADNCDPQAFLPHAGVHLHCLRHPSSRGSTLEERPPLY
jgi:hypothetical protein